MTRFVVLALIVGIVLCLTPGCSDNAPSPTSTGAEEISELNEFDNSDEAPCFGLKDLPGMIEDPEFDYADPIMAQGSPLISDTYGDVRTTT